MHDIAQIQLTSKERARLRREYRKLPARGRLSTLRKRAGYCYAQLQQARNPSRQRALTRQIRGFAEMVTWGTQDGTVDPWTDRRERAMLSLLRMGRSKMQKTDQWQVDPSAGTDSKGRKLWVKAGERSRRQKSMPGTRTKVRETVKSDRYVNQRADDYAAHFSDYVSNMAKGIELTKKEQGNAKRAYYQLQKRHGKEMLKPLREKARRYLAEMKSNPNEKENRKYTRKLAQLAQIVAMGQKAGLIESRTPSRQVWEDYVKPAGESLAMLGQDLGEGALITGKFMFTRFNRLVEGVFKFSGAALRWAKRNFVEHVLNTRFMRSIRKSWADPVVRQSRLDDGMHIARKMIGGLMIGALVGGVIGLSGGAGGAAFGAGTLAGFATAPFVGERVAEWAGEKAGGFLERMSDPMGRLWARMTARYEEKYGDKAKAKGEEKPAPQAKVEPEQQKGPSEAERWKQWASGKLSSRRRMGTSDEEPISKKDVQQLVKEFKNLSEEEMAELGVMSLALNQLSERKPISDWDESDVKLLERSYKKQMQRMKRARLSLARMGWVADTSTNPRTGKPYSKNRQVWQDEPGKPRPKKTVRYAKGGGAGAGEAKSAPKKKAGAGKKKVDASKIVQKADSLEKKATASLGKDSGRSKGFIAGFAKRSLTMLSESEHLQKYGSQSVDRHYAVVANMIGRGASLEDAQAAGSEASGIPAKAVQAAEREIVRRLPERDRRRLITAAMKKADRDAVVHHVPGSVLSDFSSGLVSVGITLGLAAAGGLVGLAFGPATAAALALLGAFGGAAAVGKLNDEGGYYVPSKSSFKGDIAKLGRAANDLSWDGIWKERHKAKLQRTVMTSLEEIKKYVDRHGPDADLDLVNGYLGWLWEISDRNLEEIMWKMRLGPRRTGANMQKKIETVREWITEGAA